MGWKAAWKEEEHGLGQGEEEATGARSTFNKAIIFDEGYCRMGDNTARIKQGPLQRPQCCWQNRELFQAVSMLFAQRRWFAPPWRSAPFSCQPLLRYDGWLEKKGQKKSKQCQRPGTLSVWNGLFCSSFARLFHKSSFSIMSSWLALLPTAVAVTQTPRCRRTFSKAFKTWQIGLLHRRRWLWSSFLFTEVIAKRKRQLPCTTAYDDDDARRFESMPVDETFYSGEMK